MPAAVEDGRLGPIQADGEVEDSIAGGQPVRFALGSGVLALDVEIERAVGVELQVIAIADGEAVDGIGDEVAIFVVGGDGPEGLHGRKDGCVEMHAVAI